jgi:hypothetical protein
MKLMALRRRPDRGRSLGRKFRSWSKYFDNLTRRSNCVDMGLVMVRPAVMAGAANGIRTVVVAKANAAPAAPLRGWLPCPPSLQGQGATSYRNVAPP